MVGDVAGGLDTGAVGQGHSYVLSLASVKGLAPKQLAFNTSSREAVIAVEAVTAGLVNRRTLAWEQRPRKGNLPRCRKGGNDFIANLDSLDCRANLYHGSGELVAHDEARVGRLVAAIGVKLTQSMSEGVVTGPRGPEAIRLTSHTSLLHVL